MAQCVPAMTFVLIEGLADGGVKQGLPRPISQSLATQTAHGAAHMVLKEGKHPGQLKDNVSSPAGTTIEAIHSLESLGYRDAVIKAVLEASNA